MQPPRARRSSAPGSSAAGSRRRRRREANRRLLMWIGGGVAGVVLLPVLAFAVAIALVEPATYKARIQAAALQSFGRELNIRGNVSVRPSLSPTLIADDVTLANFEGGSRSDMVRIDQMEVQLSPAALLVGRFVIVRLVLLHPDILLETNAAGEGNWRFDRPSTGAPPAAALPVPKPPPPPSQPQTGLAQNTAAQNLSIPDLSAQQAPRRATAGGAAPLALQTLHIRDGRLVYRDGQTGRSIVFEIKRVSATAATVDSPVRLESEIGIGRQRVIISAQTGPLSRLQDPAAQTAWGLFMNVDVSGAKLTVAGSMTRPLEGRGYSVRIDGAVRDLVSLGWLSPVDLPPLHNVTFTAKLLDQGTVLPDISSVVVQAGLTNLDKISPGFTLETARIEMPRLSEPVVATMEGTFAALPLKLNATIGAPSLLLPGNKTNLPFTIDATAEAGGASVAVRGAILEPANLTRMDIALGARVADLSTLSPLAGRPLPPLKSIAFTAHLVDPPPGAGTAGLVPAGVMLKGAILTLPQGDLSGDVTLRLGDRPSLEANFESSRIDVDGLRAVWSAPARDERPVTPQANGDPVDVTSPQPLPRRSNALIPDRPLPMALLDRGDGDLQMSVAEVQVGGSRYRDVSGHAELHAGKLVLDPFRAEVPGGRLDLAASVDSRPEASPVTLSLRAPALDLKPLLAAFGIDDLATGSLLAEADLRAAGRSLHALAATLDGKLGVGLSDAAVDNNVLGALLGDVLRAAHLPQPPAEAGTTKLRCLVLRMDMVRGAAAIGPAVLDSPRALVNAFGRANLGEETLALQVRPMLRTGGPGIVAPLRVEGSFREPKFSLDSGGTVQSALAAVTGRKGAVDAASFPGERGGDSCTPALASVRGLAPQLSSLATPAPAATPSDTAAAIAVPGTR